MKQSIINMLLLDKIGLNEVCINCKAKNNMVTTPQTPYIISNNSTLTKDRIMFIGKVARGDGFGEMIEDNLEDVTSFGEELLSDSAWAYYAYTREIIERYYGDLDKAIEHISFANIMKCNNETTNDSTPWDAKICCIDKNQFIWKEINIIKPKRIIFYTHYYYDLFIENFRPLNYDSIKDITDKNHRIKIGMKTSLYWHREFYDKDNNIICTFLRVSHPMLKNKNDFVQMIISWLLQTVK